MDSQIQPAITSFSAGEFRRQPALSDKPCLPISRLQFIQEIHETRALAEETYGYPFSKLLIASLQSLKSEV